MDANDLNKLRNKYSLLSDEEIKEMLYAGKDGFEPEAFNLLVEEGRKRQVELGNDIASAEQNVPPAQAIEKELEDAAYAELAVINDPDDVVAVREDLGKAGMNFYLQPISYTAKELPVALMVQQDRAEEAIGILQKRTFRQSIVLW